MKTLVMFGGHNVAPVYLSTHGFAPSWSGKKSSDLSQDEIAAIHVFSMHEAWELGYDDVLEGREEGQVNPFHLAFLHGVPSAMFHCFYRKGRAAAMGQSQVSTCSVKDSPRAIYAKALYQVFAGE